MRKRRRYSDRELMKRSLKSQLAPEAPDGLMYIFFPGDNRRCEPEQIHLYCKGGFEPDDTVWVDDHQHWKRDLTYNMKRKKHGNGR